MPARSQPGSRILTSRGGAGVTEKPRPTDPRDDAPSLDAEDGETWIADQALELHKLISDRHARAREEGDRP
jgi:hypothetical protein